MEDPPQEEHHKRARERNKAAKEKTKSYYDKKHRTKTVDLQIGDKVLKRQKTTTKKGPWEKDPFEVTHIKRDRVTATRGAQTFDRHRGDWKLRQERPDRLKFKEKMEPIAEEIYDDGDFDLVDYTPVVDNLVNLQQQNAQEEAPPVQHNYEGAFQNFLDTYPEERTSQGVAKICSTCETLVKTTDHQRTCVCSLATQNFTLASHNNQLVIQDQEDLNETNIAYVRFPTTRNDTLRPDLTTWYEAAEAYNLPLAPDVLSGSDTNTVSSEIPDYRPIDTSEEEDELPLAERIRRELRTLRGEHPDEEPMPDHQAPGPSHAPHQPPPQQERSSPPEPEDPAPFHPYMLRTRTERPQPHPPTPTRRGRRGGAKGKGRGGRQKRGQ